MKKTENEKDNNSPYDFYFWIGAEAEQFASLRSDAFTKRVQEEAAREASRRKPLPEV